MELATTPTDGAPSPRTPRVIGSELYRSAKPWDSSRPGTLVLACSDGRLQEVLDEFLDGQLGISHYDRLYAPGGPGALLPGAGDYLRACQFQVEFTFLLQAHAIQDVILFFHGPGPGGPPHAVCADYQRKFSCRAPGQIGEQQERDAQALIQATGLEFIRPAVRVRVYRAEILREGVRIVGLAATGAR